jgi:hypothetical protein
MHYELRKRSIHRGVDVVLVAGTSLPTTLVGVSAAGASQLTGSGVRSSQPAGAARTESSSRSSTPLGGQDVEGDGQVRCSGRFQKLMGAKPQETQDVDQYLTRRDDK